MESDNLTVDCPIDARPHASIELTSWAPKENRDDANCAPFPDSHATDPSLKHKRRQGNRHKDSVGTVQLRKRENSTTTLHARRQKKRDRVGMKHQMKPTGYTHTK